MDHTTTNQMSRPRVLAGIAPFTGTFGRNELIHLLKRTMFGVKKADIDAFNGKTVTQVVDALLAQTAPVPSPPINAYDNAAAVPPKIDEKALAGTTWIGTNIPEYTALNNFGAERRGSLRSWWFGNMLAQDRSLSEKMLLFWHNHFSTETIDTSAILGYHHTLVLRRNALGNFKTFVKEITLDPNMLRYLNGYLNKKTAPDENYGRELQELFTQGKGVDSRYTEDDVKAAARVLTGWSFKNNFPNTVDGTDYQLTFTAANHDATNKTFSANYGNKVITGGATQALAEKELDDMLAMMMATNEVAKFICRKLYTFFIYYEIDATTELNVITPLADIFRLNNYEIKPVLKALFSSQHFFDAANQGCMIKSPVDYVVGMAREFNMDLPTATNYVEQYAGWNTLATLASQQGQNVTNPPNVAGWPAYYQMPIFHEFWINTDSFPRRVTMVNKLLTTNGYGLGNSKKLVINMLAFTDQFGADAGDPNKLIVAALELLWRVPASAKFKASLKGILLSGQTTDYYWTDAWTAYKTTPTTTNTTTVTNLLKSFYAKIITQPEYHLG